jgi:hypothetical protein
MIKEYLSFIDNTEQILEIYKRVISPKFSFKNQKQLHIIFNEYKDKTRNNTSILEIRDLLNLLSRNTIRKKGL